MQKGISTPATTESSRVGRRFGWFMSWRTPGHILANLAVFVTLLVLFYAEEDWRGKHDWEVCKCQLEANGVELDWHKFVPPPVPDDQNFAMTPFLAPLFDFNPRPFLRGQSPWRDQEGWARVTNFAAAFVGMGDFWKGDPFQPGGRMTDLENALFLLQKQTNSAATQQSYSTRAEAAAFLLRAFEEFKPVMDELHTASHRSYCRFNISYDDDDPMSMLVPHIGVLRRVAQVLQVRASAELALGKTEDAFDDAGFMLFVAETLHKEPLLISHAVRLVILRSVQQIIWEGLAERRWSDTQLRDFQARLQITPLKDLSWPRMAERAAFGVKFFDFARNHPNGLRTMLAQNEDNFWASALLAAPAGWLYQEQISLQRLYGENAFPYFDPQTGQIHPRIIDANSGSADKEANGTFSSFLHHTTFSKMMLPNLLKLFQKSAVAQAGVDQTVLACALERYRAANGRFPETLAAVAPQFIDKVPVDVCTGQPLKYRLEADGRFLLYSVGWNEKDDGGTVAMEKGSQSPALTQGDWVWSQYPQK